MAIAAPDVSARARAAARELAPLRRARKDAALEAIAARIEQSVDAICEANELDLADARTAGTSSALLDRLTLDAPRVTALASAVRAVARLADPVGETITGWRLPNGLDVQKVRIPLGVLLVVYEARPNVTADVAALAIKSGNACILRGSSSARRTNAVLIDAVRSGLEDAGLPADSVVDYACSRDELAAFVADVKSCDVVIPRGGEQLKDFLIEHARVPVLAAAGGNCHVYLDASADHRKALEIIVNAKTQRPGVCNAAETLLVHREALPALAAIGVALRDSGVELRADADAAEALGVPSVAATEEDWATEYLDLVLAIRTVESVEEAIDHIETYSTGHSEAIVTESLAAADAFISGIGSACVYVNASTRFTDGGEFGFGAEIANSTSRLHARGPIGLADVTTTKYVVRGSGQIRA
ncbi:MAG: glutamate-5-semialdehyde dehydrogenase [Gaiellales bacterium]|nr:glutamate-5-semialdehyde dehydrogenase [Gaiellales bacterium]